MAISRQILEQHLKDFYQEKINRLPKDYELDEIFSQAPQESVSNFLDWVGDNYLFKEIKDYTVNAPIAGLDITSNPVMQMLGIDLNDPNSFKLDTNDISDGKRIYKKYGTGSAENGRYEWQGCKLFDKIMMTLVANLNILKDNGLIANQEYPTYYMQCLTLAMQTALNILLDQKKLLTNFAQTFNQIVNDQSKREAEIKVLRRQRLGFDDNIMLRLAQAQFDSFGTIFSSGMVEDLNTGPLKASEMSNMYSIVKDRAR